MGFIILSIFYIGCATFGSQKYDNTYYPPTNPDNIAIYSFTPQQEFIRVGEVYASGAALSNRTAMVNKLKIETAAMGGDAIVLQYEEHYNGDYVTQSGTHIPMNQPIMKGLVIRYKNRPENGNTNDNSDMSALMQAAEKGDTETVNDLLAKGADVNAKDSTGRTTLIYAAFKGHTEIVQALLAKGAEVNAKDSAGGTALIIAAVMGHADTVQVLLEKGADVNAKSNNGGTALMGTAAMGYADTVQVLLAKGAEVNAKTNQGWTALKAAADNKHPDIVKLLKSAGAKE